MITFWQAVWKCVLPDAATKIVLLKLADHANTEGLAWPSLATIAKETSLCLTAVKKKIAWLDREGFIQRRSSTDRVTSNRYVLSLEKINAAQASDDLPEASEGRASNAQRSVATRPGVGRQATGGRPPGDHEPSLNPHLTVNEPTGSFLKDTSGLPFSSPPFLQAWKDWQAHRREQRQKTTPTAERLQIRQLTEMGETRAIAALRHSTASGYTGLYEPKDAFSKTKPINLNRTSKYHAAPIL